MDEGRFYELAAREYSHSGFLDMEEQSAYLELVQKSGLRPGTLWGGYEDAERKMLYYGYTQPPLTFIEILPKAGYNVKLPGHRDYLGSLMGLGIKRQLLGDILISSDMKRAWVICVSFSAEYICENLVSAGRARVTCRTTDGILQSEIAARKEIRCTVASLRADCLAAEAFNISRAAVKELAASGKLFVNSRQLWDPSRIVEEGSKITVRGKGSFIISEIGGRTRKDRISVVLEI